MSIFVLIPGMWHGGWCWQRVAPLLRAGGHSVYTVALTGVGERSYLRSCEIAIDTHVQDVLAVLEAEDLHRVTLVGHSLAGAMCPAVATAVPERVEHVVNLDGFLATAGESFRDALPDMLAIFRGAAEAAGDAWWSPPPADWDFGLTRADLAWARSRLTPHPLRTWLDPPPVDDTRWAGIPRTFISCAAGESPERLAEEERLWVDRGWNYQAIDSVHDAMIAHPEMLAQVLVNLA
jgi:pimeloyl-ACP methyl ester carboxylesterase